MSETGTYLAQTIMSCNSDIIAELSADGTMTSKQGQALLNKVIDDMHAEFEKAEELTISPAGLNIILIALSNYSAVERYTYEQSGSTNKFDAEARKQALKKTFDFMLKQADLAAGSSDQEVIPPSTAT